MAPSHSRVPTAEQESRDESPTTHAQQRGENEEETSRNDVSGNLNTLPNGEVVTYEVIHRDYAPNHKEVVYDARARQFYRVILHSQVPGGQDDMISLRPLPADTSAIPITELATDIGRAMDDDAFYRVTVNPEAVFTHDRWCRTAMADAPEPADTPAKSNVQEAGPQRTQTNDEPTIAQIIEAEWLTL